MRNLSSFLPKIKSPLLRGLSWLSLLQGGTAGLIAVVGIFMARDLGKVLFGKVNFAQSVLLYAIPIAAFGTHLWGTREVASTKGNTKSFAFQLVGLRTLLAVLVFAAISIFALLKIADPTTRQLTFLFGLSLFPLAWVTDWVLQGQERMQHVAVTRALRQGGYALGILLVLILDLDLLWFPMFYLLSVLLAASYSAILLRWAPDRPGDLVDPQAWGRSLAGSWEIGLAVIAHMGLYRLDSIFVGIYHGEGAVGIYSAAGNIVLTLLMVPPLLRDVLLPRLTIHWRQDPDKLPDILRKASRGAIALGLLVALGISISADDLVLLLYKEEFASAGSILQIFIWIFPFALLTAVLSATMIVVGRQRYLLYTILTQAVLHLLAIYLLVPIRGPIAAAEIIVCIDALGISLECYFLRDLVGKFLLRIAGLLLAALASLAFFSGIPAAAELPVLYRLFGSLFLYVALLVATGSLRLEDLRTIRDRVPS